MDRSFPATADSTGTAVVTIDNAVPSGRQWNVWQITVETVPVRSGINATIRRNGRYITSTIVGGGSSAQGPPAIILEPNSVLTVTWVGLTPGDEAVATLLYEEVPVGGTGNPFGLV